MADTVPSAAPSRRAHPVGSAPRHTPPKAARRPVELVAHGDVRVDDFYWLRDRDDPEVIAYLEAENAFTAAQMAGSERLTESLFTEMVARIKETDLSVPVRKGPWLYYGRTQEGNNYGIHCRRPVPADPDPDPGEGTSSPVADEIPDDEQVLLDENALARGHDYFALGILEVSPDHRWLAYSTDTTGGERFEMRFVDLEGGVESPESIEDTTYGAAWANDNATVFYVRVDQAMRPFQLWRHRVGGQPEADVLVYEEPDDHFYLGVGRTRDDAFVLLHLESKMTTEVHRLAADEPEGAFVVIERRRHGVEYHVDHDHRGSGDGGRFLIVTNDGAEDFRLVEVQDSSPSREHWREVIPHRPGIRLDGIDAFAGHLVVYERERAETRIRVIDAETGVSRTVAQPESPSTVWAGANPEYASEVLRYEYSSLVTPRSIFDLDLRSGSTTLRKRQPVLGAFRAEEYRTERRWAKSEDGTDVPISLVYRPDLVPGPEGGRPSPCLLYGYGSYEASMDPIFSSLRLSLLDRGFVYAIAHVRGGGELGRRWYEEGRLSSKPNTFIDFVACARALVDEGWTTPDMLVARGGSAGGLLMGAVANRAPELFRAIVAEVPFVDCLTTILDESLPLTVLEWEEWGNPVADASIYRLMKSYSPYDNVRVDAPDATSIRYPAILATGGLTDPRVGFWEPAKWAAKLRMANPENKVLLKTELEAGHGGPSGRYDAWRDEAFVYTFVLTALGLDSSTPDPDVPSGGRSAG